MGKLQAKVTGGLIRASVAVTATTDTAHATSINTLKAGVQYVVAAADLAYIWFVLDVQLDTVGYNKFPKDISIVADQAVLGVSKRLTESQAAVDEAHYLLFKKGAAETLHPTETRVFSIQKALVEVLHATDDFYGSANVDDDETMVFSKSIAVEQQHALDSAKTTFGKRATETLHPSETRVFLVSKRLTDTAHPTDAQAVAFSKRVTDAVDAGDEFNATAITDDGEVMVFGKRLTDDFSQTDFVSVQPEKGVQDDAYTLDQIDSIEVGKGVEDAPQTTEMVAFDTSKPLTDSAAMADITAFGFGVKPADRVYYGDGPNAYNTYAIGYFAETYALEGFPAVSFSKSLADTVHSTDDFFGVANTDDDEVMQFGKILTDLAHPTDSARVTYSKALADLVSKSDSSVYLIGKGISDTAIKSDAATLSTGKALSDTKTTSDATVRGIGKGISDNSVTAEYNIFAIQKKLSDSVITTDDFLGNANADDDETMLFGKTISDSFTKSDLTVKTAGKGLAETASTSESGSIVWTDYWPIGYTDTTSSVYVGTRRTF